MLSDNITPPPQSSEHIKAYVLLHPDDNILVCCKPLDIGTVICVEGVEYTIFETVSVGHKIARRRLAAGDKVVRYGAPIGSVTQDVEAGFHIHTHNLKSDYIPSHGRNAVHLEGKE